MSKKVVLNLIGISSKIRKGEYLPGLEMASYYHYTNSESLVKIVKEKMLLSSEGSGFAFSAAESVFLTGKVKLNNFLVHLCVKISIHIRLIFHQVHILEGSDKIQQTSNLGEQL